MSDALQFSASIENDAEVKRRFLDAGSTVRAQIRRALAEVGAQMRDKAQALAPSRTGALARSIKDRLTENGNGLTLTVSPGKFYARFVEFGTAPHATGSLRLALSKGEKGYARNFRRAQARTDRESGDFRTQPEPFMGPAWENLRDQIQESLAAAVSRGVAEAEE